MTYNCFVPFSLQCIAGSELSVVCEVCAMCNVQLTVCGDQFVFMNCVLTNIQCIVYIVQCIMYIL